MSLSSSRLARSKYTKSDRYKGCMDESYEFVRLQKISPNLTHRRKRIAMCKRRLPSPKRPTLVTTTLQALVLPGTLIPMDFNI